MKSILTSVLICFLFISSSSCSKNKNNEVEAELQLYFSSFVEAAAEQGLEISLDDLDIDGYIENIEKRGTLGQCKSYSNGSKQIVIDESYWERSNEMEREYIVFHELGHCVLGREHTDTRDENGNCMSIMQSGEGTCKSMYDLENRALLLVELFENG